MEVLVTNDQEAVELDISFIKEVSLEIMRFEGDSDNTQLSLVFCNDESIKEINNEYRHKNESTDVLSFPIELENFIPEIRMLGDIVISTETAIKQANEYKHSVETEIVILLIHGLLHLHGYDHIEECDLNKMRARESEIFKHICSIEKFSKLGNSSSESLIKRVS